MAGSPPGVPHSSEQPVMKKSGRPRNHRPDCCERTNSSTGNSFASHVITVDVGEDIVAKLLSFAQQRPRALYILSGSGLVSSVTICQPASTGVGVTYEGCFQILCQPGSYLIAEEGSPCNRTGGVSVSLSSPDGHVIGGVVAMLIAASPVQVMVCSSVHVNAKAPDWSNLPRDLLISILKRKSITFDHFAAFSAVCSSWRSAAAEERQRFDKKQQQYFPWLMFYARDFGSRTKFYNLCSMKESHQLLTEPRRQAYNAEERVYSSLGWIMTTNMKEFSLFNPLSRAVIKLPTQNNLNGDELVLSPKKFVLSASPSWTSDYMVMIITPLLFKDGPGYISFWKPGRSSWTQITGFENPNNFVDMTYYKDRFYAVDTSRQVRDFTIEKDSETSNNYIINVVSVVDIPKPDFPIENERLYVVEYAESLLVASLNAGVEDPRAKNSTGRRYAVYEVNVCDGTIKMVTRWGDGALFFGKSSSSFSVKASQTRQANSIHMNNGEYHIMITDSRSAQTPIVSYTNFFHHSPVWVQSNF